MVEVSLLHQACFKLHQEWEGCFVTPKRQVTYRLPTVSTDTVGILQARVLEWVAFLSPGDLPNPGIEPRSPASQVDSLPAEPQGKPKNPGVGSLSLLQWIFPTQESSQGLLHCRQIRVEWVE